MWRPRPAPSMPSSRSRSSKNLPDFLTPGPGIKYSASTSSILPANPAASASLMTGPLPADSWSHFDTPEPAGRSEAWTELLGLGATPRLSPASLFSEMDGAKPDWTPEPTDAACQGTVQDLFQASTPTLQLSTSLSPVTSEADLQHEVYRRAAQDFVQELAGPQATTPGTCSSPHPADKLLRADDLPVAAFAVGRDAHFTVWNKHLAELSGREEAEVVSCSLDPSAVFTPMHPWKYRDCGELLRSVLFGSSSPEHHFFWLSCKPGHPKNRGYLHSHRPAPSPRVPRPSLDCTPAPARPPPGGVSTEAQVAVELRLSQRTDAVGKVSGVLCVVVPSREPLLPAAGDLVPRGPHDGSPSRRPRGVREQSPHRRSQTVTVFNEVGPSSSAGSDTSEASMLLSRTGSESAPQSPAFLGATLPGLETLVPLGGLTLGAGPVQEPLPAVVRALVMDSADAVRHELAQNLERCGVSTVCCASLAEAAWRFGRSVAEGPRFDVIFLELSQGEELFLAIRDLRRVEVEANMMRQGPEQEGAGPGEGKGEEEQAGPEGSGGELREVEDAAAASADRDAPAAASLATGDHRCLIIASVNLNRWDLAGLDAAMEHCVRAGGDAVLPRSMPLQQLRTALRKLGVRSKYLSFPQRLPRALSGPVHNPLNMSR